MASTFQVDVVSPEATVWSGEAVILIARTPEGELGIMADHEPLMGALTTGAVSVQSESGERTTIGVYGGFIQVLNNQVDPHHRPCPSHRRPRGGHRSRRGARRPRSRGRRGLVRKSHVWL